MFGEYETSIRTPGVARMERRKGGDGVKGM